MSYKPEGSPTVSPYLVVENAQASLDFIEAVFGVAPPRVFRRDDGSIMHAEARIEDSVVMIGEMPGGPDAHVHVYVPDAEATFGRAIEAGGTVVQPVELKPEGDRRGGVRDSNGTTWWVSTAA